MNLFVCDDDDDSLWEERAQREDTLHGKGGLENIKGGITLIIGFGILPNRNLFVTR